ncbi:hypothetical protein [Arcobacter arenosus]|uniref:hypothetical protein n=1 Tax=Arcobacter arenosus TaxID=2576037 RepID=UPI003BAD5916
MKIFDFKVSSTRLDTLDKNCYSFFEQKNYSNLPYKLTLNNNQLRKIQIQSDKSFNSIQKNQILSFIVEDVVTFVSKIDSNEIFFIKGKLGNDTLIKYWLYHTFFPILLTFESRYYFLHAGAVEIENTPVLFIADAFGGKSTMTDFFMKKGHTMISDDKVGTYEKDNMILSVPSYPYHRPYRKMEDLGLFVENFAKDSKPINCIFNLVKSDENSDIFINKISGIEKFKALKYATDIDLPINQKQRFQSLTNIANKVDIYDITIPWDLNRLEEVYQTIVEFIKNKKVI